MNNYRDVSNLARLLMRVQKFLEVSNKKCSGNTIIAIPIIDYDRVLIRFMGHQGTMYELYFWENHKNLLSIEVPVIGVDYFHFAEECKLTAEDIKYIREI